MTGDGRAYRPLLGLGALDAAGYSVIVPVAPEIADATGAGPAMIGLTGFAAWTPAYAGGDGRELPVPQVQCRRAGARRVGRLSSDRARDFREDKTVRRTACPNCGEPLVRAAKHPETPWHIDEEREDEEDEG